MNRRSFLAAGLAAASVSRPAAAAPKTRMGIGSAAFWMRREGDTIEFLEYCHSLGAGGIQAGLKSTDPAYVKKLRARAEELGMYLEINARLPDADTSEFEAIVKATKELGGACIRSVCLSGRRYETFATMEEWSNFVDKSKSRVAKAVPVCARYKIPLALENHKDWMVEEMLGLLKANQSDYFGVTLDMGNNISLLEDPMTVIREFAPYAKAVHIKDMAVAEYEDGFLLSEVPFGDGMIDLAEAAAVIKKHNPKINFTCEMMTRDPLKVPVLTDKYWVTWPKRPAPALARTLRMVRQHKPAKPLPMVSTLDKQAQLALEERNNVLCVQYAAQHLSL